MNRVIGLTFILLMVVIPVSVFSQEKTGDGIVKTSMVADISKLDSENKFYIGIMFRMKPGWHIFWKNPGDSGFPTRIDFRFPEKFVHSDLYWPLPEQFSRSGDIRDYGYDDRVLLWTVVNVPDSYISGSEIPVEANINWVACREHCIPGNRKISSVIRPGVSKGINNTELFSEWEQMLPVKKGKEYTYRTSYVSSNGRVKKFQINLDFRNLSVDSINWLPDPGGKLKIQDISYEINQVMNTGKIFFHASLMEGKMLSSPNMDSVLVINTTDGNSTGYIMPVRVIEVLKKADPAPEDKESKAENG